MAGQVIGSLLGKPVWYITITINGVTRQFVKPRIPGVPLNLAALGLDGGLEMFGGAGDCRTRECPSVESLVNNPELMQHFERIWDESERTHREGGFYILMAEDLDLYVTETYWGEPWSGTVPFPKPPSTAIAEFHTHYSIGTTPGGQLSTPDVQRRAYWGIHSIVYDRNTVFYQSFDERIDDCIARNPTVICR